MHNFCCAAPVFQSTVCFRGLNQTANFRKREARESSEKLYDAREGWKKLLSEHCKGYSDQRCVFLTKFLNEVHRAQNANFSIVAK